MHILLTGASGLVGHTFAAAAARRGHRVTGLTFNHAGDIPGLHSRRMIDGADDAALTSLALEVFPDVIVNAAAVADPASCEADPVRSQQLNVALPATLARLAHHLSARFVHISSEQVFDGANAPFGVKSTPKPINLYGRQKLESERAVHKAAPAFAVTVRAPLLTGNSLNGSRSLHEKLFADWSAGRTPSLYTDEIRQPCTAGNLAEVLLELCERRDLLGVYHWAGAETLSRHQIGARIREHFKLSPEAAPIAAVNRTEKPAPHRPADLSLDLKPLAGLLKTPLETFDAQLDQLTVPAPFRDWYFKV